MDRYSIRFHAFGGQGMKSMIQEILAPLCVYEGFYAQAFPYFGGERRGALVAGYFRCGQKKIATHSFINAPNMVAVFDDRIPSKKAAEGLSRDGTILVNTSDPNKFIEFTDCWRVFTVDARQISINHGIGKKDDPFPVVNAAMAGAVIRVLEFETQKVFSDTSVGAALAAAVPQKVAGNMAAFYEGKRTVKQLFADAPPAEQRISVGSSDVFLCQPDEKCTHCNLCSLFCPKRAIHVVENDTYVIQHDQCNLCGICVSICPRRAISFATNEISEAGEINKGGENDG